MTKLKDQSFLPAHIQLKKLKKPNIITVFVVQSRCKVCVCVLVFSLLFANKYLKECWNEEIAFAVEMLMYEENRDNEVFD